jgi:hypothetical protein
MQANPMPMLTGRVCAHFCQDECNQAGKRRERGYPHVERYLGDYILDHSESFIKPPAALPPAKKSRLSFRSFRTHSRLLPPQNGHEVTVHVTVKRKPAA